MIKALYPAIQSETHSEHLLPSDAALEGMTLPVGCHQCGHRYWVNVTFSPPPTCNASTVVTVQFVGDRGRSWWRRWVWALFG